MGGGPVVATQPSSWPKTSDTSNDAPANSLVNDSVVHNTLEAPVKIKPDGVSLQSPWLDENDTVGIESYKNTEADDAEDETATVTGWEQDSANLVAMEVQTIEADNQDPPLHPETMIRQLDTRPISIEQLVKEVRGIYAGLSMVECKCKEVDNSLMPPTSGPLDVTRYLLVIPSAKLILLQASDMKPDDTVRTWFIGIQKDATEGDKSSTPATGEDLPATPDSSSTTTDNLSTTLKDRPMTPEEAPAHPHVPDKTAAPQVCSPEDYLHGFQVALELRAKELGWPECEELAVLTTAEIGEEGRKKVIDERYFLEIGNVLVDQFLQDLETAKAKADNWGLDPKKKPEASESIFVDMRPLKDQNLYKKVGKQHWVLIGGEWILSLDGDVYAALITLHRTLLHEHHDFFLASQHPSASPALRRLATKYSMPARMWRHATYAFLEVLRKRLPESQEFIDSFIILAYGMISLLVETVPQFLSTWIECKADLARYRMAIEDVDIEVKQRWRDTSKEEYTRVQIDGPMTGRIYHHLAILERPRSSPDKDFDATVSEFFYHTKSLVVKTPFSAARESMLASIKLIVTRNKEAAEKPASVPRTDKDHFLSAVVHLILATLEPEALRNDHLQAVYAALEKIKIGGPAKTPKIHPSAKLGLLLCHLLLGIPLTDKRWSPMMAAWAPDLVTAEDRADSDAMANARDIHDATIEMIRTMVPYLLEEADTRDLGVWGFIYVILVFMRSLKTRPNLLEWFGSAFHAKVLAPFLNMLLREDETRGGSALESAPQSVLVTVHSMLNERQKPGKYGFSTEDNIKKYHREQEEQQEAERAESSATTEETTISDAAHERDGDTKTPDWELMYANPLPEHFLLSGLFFAKEAEPCDKPLEDSTPEAAPAAVQTAEEPAVEQAQEVSLTDSEVREAEEARLAEEERDERKAKEAEVRRQEGLFRDPPLFTHGWLKNSKYSFDEIVVHDYVQNVETCFDRSTQILHLAAQLDGDFFVFEIDEEERYWISVPGASSVPKPDPNKKMPEIIERDGGVRVVYVDPSSHTAEIEREKRRLAKEERRKQEKHAKATTDVATAVDEKAEGDGKEISAASDIAEASQSTDMIEQRSVQSEEPINHVDAKGALGAVNIPAGALSMKSESDDIEPISAYHMGLDKTAHIRKATTVAEKPSSTHDAKPTEAGAETTLPVQGVDNSQDTKDNNAVPDAVTALADDQAAATVPRASVQLTEGVLDKMLGIENSTKAIMRWRAPRKGPGADEGVDEDGWTHISDESHGNAETAPTVQMAQVDTRSMISRLFFR